MNIKKRIPITLVLAVSSVFGIAMANSTIKEQEQSNSRDVVPEMMVSGHVIDESGKPVENARVKFYYNSDPKEIADRTFIVFTDSKGAFSGRAHCLWGSFEAGVKKEGYYSSGVPIPRPTDMKDNRWFPWNPTVKAVLRPIRNPIPMYEKRVDSQVPVNGQPCGFDLLKGDWVAPWGKGEIADFVFTSQCEYISPKENRTICKLTFSNPNDGIQEVLPPKIGNYSAFKWYYEAPMENYEPEYTFFKYLKPNKPRESQWKEGRYYYFRIRTKTDGKKITEGYYGNLGGGGGVSQKKTPGTCLIGFRYFLNPTPLDRNMENDRQKNFFPEPESKPKPEPKPVGMPSSISEER